VIAPSDPLYCTVFIDSALPRGELLALVAQAVGGGLDGNVVVSPTVEIAIKRNGYVDGPPPAPGSEFLAYRHYAEVERTQHVSRDAYVASIGRLLEDLWHRGIPAVAACDFEDELPAYPGRDRVLASQNGDGHNSLAHDSLRRRLPAQATGEARGEDR
jgi:hypothetical protein